LILAPVRRGALETVTGFVGRDGEIAEAVAALRAGVALLVKGRAGIGKSAFLRQLYARLSKAGPCVWAADTNAKTMTYALAEQVHHAVSLQVPARFIPKSRQALAHRTGRVQWAWIQRSLSRAPAREVLALVIAFLRGQGVVVFIESLDVPPTQAEMFHALAEVAQLAAAMSDDNRRARIQRLLWRVQAVIELKPLTRAERWLAARPIAFTSPRVRAAFLRAVEQDSGGVPAAIEGMLVAATNDGEVTSAKVRAYRHEAAARHLDMTPLVVVALLVAIATRYVSRGVGEAELLVFSGVASALLYGLTLMLRKLAR